MSIVVTLLALLIEATIGYPDRALRTIGHPVTWIGGLIAWLDRRLNREHFGAASRRLAGIVAVVVIIAVSAGVAAALQYALSRIVFGTLAIGLLASTLLAQRSLHAHVGRVADALETEGLAGGRAAVSHIVGRDTAVLDEAGVSRGAIESLAENFSDAIVAPAFWLALGGLGAGAAYKAINTADSMIGHRTPRHAAFGFAAARLDDLVNLPASRLSALLIIMAAAITPGAAPAQAWRAVRRDARHHRSPNAGYPEAAMAGALGLSLAGPRIYDGVLVDDAAMGDGRRDAGPKDIRAALALYRSADAILIALVAAAAATVSLLPG